MRAYVLHDNDADGFGGAYAAWRKLGREGKYFPWRHHDPIPSFERDAEVYFIDTSPDRETLLRLRERVRRVVVLDHHESTRQNLEGLPDVVIDTRAAAAVVAWRYFHPDIEVPELLRYVEDRDLFTRALPETDELAAALEAYPRRFEVWHGLDVGDLRREGALLLRVQNQLVRRMVSQAREDYVAGWRVPVVNATAHITDVCHLLLERYPDAPFAAAYYDLADGRRKWSLRSRGDFDVLQIARTAGQGGGHPAAAGFVSEPET